MTIIFLVIVGFIILFGFVVLFGAPYLPTLRKQTEIALDMLDVRSGQTILELGSGDGSVALAAAKRGARIVGFELNPILVLVSRIRCIRYRRQVRIIWGNFWNKPWPEADGIFVFLLDKYMKKLDTKVIQEFSKPVKLVSFAFKIPGKKIAKERNGLYLYRY